MHLPTKNAHYTICHTREREREGERRGEGKEGGREQNMIKCHAKNQPVMTMATGRATKKKSSKNPTPGDNRHSSSALPVSNPIQNLLYTATNAGFFRQERAAVNSPSLSCQQLPYFLDYIARILSIS